MAVGTKLVTTFLNEEGSNVSYSYNYANSAADVEDVKALMAGMIANNVIFENAPVKAKSAKTVTTTEYEYDLST